MLRAAVIVLLIVLLPSPLKAEGRIALLIGNQGYNPKVGSLKNPHEDIALVGRALRSLRFDVREVKDGDYRAIDATIKRHVAMVRREGAGAVSMIYYAGHGAADPDTKINYLIPVDVANADDENLWINSLNLNKIVESLREQAPGGTHYVVFDACRNELNLTRKGQKALADKGFVPLAFTPGVMIAYSTAPGRTATDTGSGGGTYARILAEELVRPGVEAMTMFRRVALRVNREIGQDPWMSASTLPEIYFAGAPMASDPIAAPPAAAQLTEAEHAWAETKDTTSISVLEAFIRRFGDTYYGELAKARLEEIKRRSVANDIGVPQPPLARGPETQPHAQEKSGGAFDGYWLIQWYDAPGCSNPNAKFLLTISNNAVLSRGERPTTGRVDKAGKITFSRPGMVNGSTQRYFGQLTANLGSGRFTGFGRCAGRFTATRQ